MKITSISSLYACLLLLLLVSCTKKNDDPPSPTAPGKDLTADRGALSKHVADHFIVPAYGNLQVASKLLHERAENFVQSPSEPLLMTLIEALKDTWISWQSASIYQMGPTENQALRAATNLYPTNQAKIEVNISSANFALGTIGNQGAEGLPALDYLLQGEAPASTIAAFSEQGRKDYLTALTGHLAALTSAVYQDWLEGTYLKEFTSDRSRGTDVGSAIGILINTMDQHFQRYLRDGKVAIPAGVRSAGVPRPTAVEAYHGGYGRTLLQKALEAYEQLLAGEGLTSTRGMSIYEYLDNIDQSDLKVSLQLALQASLQQASKLDNSLSAQIEQDNEAMITLFLGLQDFVTLIKSDLASVVGITITNQDNDGD